MGSPFFKKIAAITMLSSLLMAFSWSTAYAVLSVPISCDLAGAACASESSLEDFTGAWSLNYGGDASIMGFLGEIAASGVPIISVVAQAVMSFIESHGGNLIARAMIPAIMEPVIQMLVEQMLGDSGSTKDGNIIKNWFQYHLNITVGSGKQFVTDIYDPNLLNLPSGQGGYNLLTPIKNELKNGLDQTYSQENQYGYVGEQLGRPNPHNMQTLQEYFSFIDPTNNYEGASIIGTSAQDQFKKTSDTAAKNEGVANQGFINTKDSAGNVIPGILSKDAYQQQITQVINGVQNIHTLAEAEGFIVQVATSYIKTYLSRKFNETITSNPSDLYQHVIKQ